MTEEFGDICLFLIFRIPDSLRFLEVDLHFPQKIIEWDIFFSCSDISLVGKTMNCRPVLSMENVLVLRSKFSSRVGNCRIEIPSNKPTYPPMLPTNEFMSRTLQIPVNYY